jgi:hypothetical protein
MADELGGLLKNKWVWIGGAALVGLALVSSLASGGNASTSSADSTLQSYNALALANIQSGTQTQLASTAAAAQDTQAFYGLISSMDTNATSVAINQQTSAAGITNTQTQANAALVMDLNNNAARTQQTWLTTGAQEQIATTQANAAVSIAKTQASAAQSNGLFGALGSIGSAAAIAAIL